MVAKSWTNFVASTTIRASQVLGNDAWAEGNIVPHSAGTLANNQFSLGTSTAKWLNLYADKITISTGTSCIMGSLGVGTTAPDKALEINHATGGCLRLTYNDSNGSATNKVDFDVSSGGTLAITPTSGEVLINNTSHATLEIRATTSDNRNAYLYLTPATTYGATSHQFSIAALGSGGLRFYDHTASAERMKIDKGGNVGIGTTSPSSTFEVQQNSGSYVSIMRNNAANGYSTIELRNSLNVYGMSLNYAGSDTGAAYKAWIHNTYNESLSLGTNGTDRLTILGGGNVGIGTTAPSCTCDVNGILRSKNPFCSVYGYNAIVDSTPTYFSFTTEVIDASNMLTSTANDKIYAPYSGLYDIRFRASVPGTSTGLIQVESYINSVTVSSQNLFGYTSQLGLSATGYSRNLYMSFYLSMTAGDFLAFKVSQLTGITLTMSCAVQMRMIS